MIVIEHIPWTQWLPLAVAWCVFLRLSIRLLARRWSR